MDRLTKLERKMGALARWFAADDYGVHQVRAEFAAIDAKPAEEPKPAPNGLRRAARDRMPLGGRDAQALEGALAMTERERDEARAEIARLKSEAKDDEEALAHYRTLTYRDGEADQLQRDLSAAFTEIETLKTEIERLEARDREGRNLVSRYRGLQLSGSDGAARCDAYLTGDPPKPDPLLVEAREVLRGLSMRNRVEGGGCWCRYSDHAPTHERYCDRAHALRTAVDRLLAAREGRS